MFINWKEKKESARCNRDELWNVTQHGRKHIHRATYSEESFTWNVWNKQLSWDWLFLGKHNTQICIPPKKGNLQQTKVKIMPMSNLVNQSFIGVTNSSDKSYGTRMPQKQLYHWKVHQWQLTKATHNLGALYTAGSSWESPFSLVRFLCRSFTPFYADKRPSRIF